MAAVSKDFFKLLCERRVILICALLFVLALGTFLPAIQNGFVGYDDLEYVTANLRVQQGLTWESLKWAFSSAAAANWHPLTWLSHMLDCEFFGLNPWGHHLTSLLLHAINTTLVFLVLQRVTNATWRSFVVAALFGLHPLRVESVAWISERKDVLSTLFWLLTLWAYARYAEKAEHEPPTSGLRLPASGCYWLTLGLFALGLMAKPMMVTGPVVLLLLDYWPLRRVSSFESRVPGLSSPISREQAFNHQWSTVWRLIQEKIPLFVLSAISCGITFFVQKKAGAVFSLTKLPFDARIENAFVSYARYLGKTFWPVDLAPFYPYPDHWPAAIVWPAFALLLIISVGAIVWRRQHPYLLTGWIWFMVTLVPVMGVVQAGEQAMADRYSYIPSIGVLLLLVWGLYELTSHWHYRGIGASAVTAATLFLCLTLTRKQISYWKDTETLFRHAIAVTENNYLAHYNLGTALDRQGRLEEALDQLQAALTAKPDYAPAHNNLGVVLVKQDRLDEAIRCYLEALTLNPAYADAHNNLGVALEKQGRLDEAISQYQDAVRLQPNHAKAHFNLGVALGRKGDWDRVITELGSALKLQPNDPEAHNNLGVAFDRKGRLDEALHHFVEALRLKPDYARAHFNLGVALSAKGRLDEALNQFQEALRLKPDYAEAQSNLTELLNFKRNAETQPSRSP